MRKSEKGFADLSFDSLEDSVDVCGGGNSGEVTVALGLDAARVLWSRVWMPHWRVALGQDQNRLHKLAMRKFFQGVKCCMLELDIYSKRSSAEE